MNYIQVETLTSGQIDDLYYLFQMEWWTKGRERKEIETMVENSNIIIGFIDVDTQELIGFARVLTDFVYKALIFDVMVNKRFRGQQLGRSLMDEIIHHPKLKSVKHFELYCRTEMRPFYEKWGFTEKLGPLHFMRRVSGQ
ncbi:GNAT family N-acetyltransferase [Neobacillus sp. OS1-32]|uniref:GNAT family N-acetyltransferase n=1 Tax=Neobacillus sp. OS1-32 TaxID=3070682 RepID=UPI0027E0BBFD|nr:GNAT family N-acetyltransferase [Neobacillus sp. OS1-32]WML29001.1 GNAT family N-acetyltransferase [Neobacillus sp. OS1-32]